jgi:hypothetical protein
MSSATARPMRCIRGSNYRKAMAELMPKVELLARLIMAKTGKLTAHDIAVLAVETELPCKTAWEFLEYAEVLPSGHWQRLSEASKAKVRGDAEQIYQQQGAA